MFKKFSYLSVCAVLAFGAYSCSDSDPDDPQKPDTPDEPSGTMEILTPAQSKQFLESTATDFLNKFRAADQRQLIELAAYAGEKYGDLEAPEEFEISPVNPAKMIGALAKAFSHADASRAGTVIFEYTYKLDFSQFTGIYVPGRDSWVKQGDSKDIIFRFDDAKGNKCELKATAAGGASEVNFKDYDYDYDYDYSNDDYTEYEYISNFEVKIPKNLTITLTAGSTTLIDAKVVSDINVKGHRCTIDADITVANLKALAKIEGNDSKATQTSSFSVSGETILSSSASLNGNHLCDIDYFEKNEDDDELAIKVLTNGKATASVLNKVSIDADVTFNADVFEALEGDWYSWNYNSKAEAQAAAQAAAKTLEKYLKTKVRYNNTTTEQASLTWGVAFDEDYWYDYWECYLEPLLKFKSDGSTYSFEEYFEKGFGSVEDLFEDILDNYERVWKNAQK